MIRSADNRLLTPGFSLGMVLRRLIAVDLNLLDEYLLGLSDETKRRFGPHPFDQAALAELYGHPEI